LLYSTWSQSRADADLTKLLQTIRTLAIRMMRGDEDAAQDALLVIHEKLLSFRPADYAKFSWWTRSIIARVRKGSIRDVIRRREDQFADEMDYEGGSPHEFEDLTILTDDMREIAVLLLLGLSMQEIAKHLQIKPDSLSKKVRRACPKMAA
jgi:DNA-directed RNA polymerase specialized sigma24 family protein